MFFAVLLCAAQCQNGLGSSLASRVRALGGGLPNGFNNYVTGINTFAFDEAVEITTDQIASKTSDTRTYSVGTGAFVGRLLIRKFFKKVGRFFSRAGSSMRIRRGRGRGVTVNRNSVVSVPYANERVSFSPFSDLNALKFATSYYKLHHHERINAPGLCLYQATAIEGKRSGKDISYRVGYGYTFGTGVGQYTVHTQRVCKKFLFIKKCKNQSTRINRGLTPAEQQAVSNGLSATLYSSIASKVASGRNLMRLSRTHRRRAVSRKHHTFQHASGIAAEDVNAALTHMLGENNEAFNGPIPEDMPVFVNDSKGQTHKIVVKGKDSKSVKVWTLVATA